MVSIEDIKADLNRLAENLKEAAEIYAENEPELDEISYHVARFCADIPVEFAALTIIERANVKTDQDVRDMTATQVTEVMKAVDMNDLVDNAFGDHLLFAKEEVLSKEEEDEF